MKCFGTCGQNHRMNFSILFLCDSELTRNLLPSSSEICVEKQDTAPRVALGTQPCSRHSSLRRRPKIEITCSWKKPLHSINSAVFFYLISTWCASFSSFLVRCCCPKSAMCSVAGCHQGHGEQAQLQHPPGDSWTISISSKEVSINLGGYPMKIIQFV